MKIRTFVKNLLLTLVTSSVLASVGLTGIAKAQIPYVPGQPLPAPTTPAFNIYTNVPDGVGNEADFVKLRKSNGDPTVPAVTSNFFNPLNASCNPGDMFDVRTYIHNGANADNNDNGNGTAVAHNVMLAMRAPLGVTDNKFGFTSTITASNAQALSGVGTLNCDNTVSLKLVPQSVHVYSTPYGWKSASDDAVNGNLTLGSPNFGSGDQWGCWEFRIIVVYTVEVVPTPPPTPTPTPTPVPTATVLPNTGAGDVFGIFGATSVAGTAAYELRRRVVKKLSR